MRHHRLCYETTTTRMCNMTIAMRKLWEGDVANGEEEAPRTREREGNIMYHSNQALIQIAMLRSSASSSICKIAIQHQSQAMLCTRSIHAVTPRSIQQHHLTSLPRTHISRTLRRGISVSTISSPLKLGYRLEKVSTSQSSPAPTAS